MKSGKKLLIGIIVFAIIIAAGVGASNYFNKDDTIKIRGAVGGGKENFLADEDVIKILRDKYNIEVQNDPWSNGRLIIDPLKYDEGGESKEYDFVFFSDQRYYEYYQLPAKDGEAPRLSRKKSMIALNTPIVIYSWDTVVEVLIKENIVTKNGDIYYITDMNKLLEYIDSGKKWSDIGLSQIYGNINIASTDPVTSSPGATYYGLLAAVMNHGDLTSENIKGVLPKLENFYVKSGFMNNTPADLFDLYMRTGMGAKPMIVDYEKSIIDFANNNPAGYEQVKDRIRILFPAPTVWNSHCIISFSDNGSILVDALNDPEIQKIAFNKYGFRTGMTGGSYDVSEIGIPGIPQEITSVIPSLRMDEYNLIITTLREAGK